MIDSGAGNRETVSGEIKRNTKTGSRRRSRGEERRWKRVPEG